MVGTYWARLLAGLALFCALACGHDAFAQYGQSCPKVDPYCQGDPRWVTATQRPPIVQVPQRQRYGAVIPWSGGDLCAGTPTGPLACGMTGRVGGALTGQIRLAQGDQIMARNAGNSADQSLIATDGANDVFIGDINASTTGLITSGSAELALQNGALGWFHAGSIGWQTASDAPLITQVQQANGSNPHTMTIAPQAPGAGAASTSTGTPGNLAVNLAAPVSTGTHAYLDIQEGGASQLRIGNIIGAYSMPTYYSTGSVLLQAASGNAFVHASGGTYLEGTTVNVRDTGGNLYWTITPGATTTMAFSSAVTTASITEGVSAGAANPMSITAQSAGGTNDGGALSVGGGAHSGSSVVDGSVKVTTPLNAGELEFTPVNGAQTLTNAQSNANIINLIAGATGGFTINILRRIADTSLLIVRNNTSQTATIAYLTGGTVTVATGTSAIIASNGSNLVKIMSGT